MPGKKGNAGLSPAPVIPFVTEPELERVLEAAHEAGATSAHYVVLRLPWDVDPLFQQWLQAHFPDRAQRVMNRVREMMGGKNYDSDFSKRMHGDGVWADQRWANSPAMRWDSWICFSKSGSAASPAAQCRIRTCPPGG